MLDTIGFRLGKIIEETQDTNQNQLAIKIDCHRSYISNWVLNKATPSTRSIFEISQVLKCNPAWLLTGKGSALKMQGSEGIIPNTEYKTSAPEREDSSMAWKINAIRKIQAEGTKAQQDSIGSLLGELLLELGSTVTNIRQAKGPKD